MFPDRRLLGPDTILIALPERLAGAGQRAGIVRLPVTRYAGPVERLGRGIGLGITIHYFPESALRFLPLLILERCLAQAECQLGQEVVRVQKALNPVLLDALGIQLEQGRRPVS